MAAFGERKLVAHAQAFLEIAVYLYESKDHLLRTPTKSYEDRLWEKMQA